jgi:FK506-binding protein 2
MKVGALFTAIALLSTSVIGSESDDLPKLKIGITKEIPEDRCTHRAKNGDKVSVHYTGKLEDGTVFDSSYDRGQPIEFVLGTGRVIQGWDSGIKGMCLNEVRKLTIPPHLGYGKQGAGNAIPPDATLHFVTELVAVNGITADAAGSKEDL